MKLNLAIFTCAIVATGAVLFAITSVQPQPVAASMRPSDVPAALVSYDDFKDLVNEAETHRAERLVDLNTFLSMSKEPGTIILDTRSTNRYERLHVKGALHLSFTDFTQKNLAEVIPDFDTRILIYCNNNFFDDPIDFGSKMAIPRYMDGITMSHNTRKQATTLALNIPTYLNLYGYGYRNIFELKELVKMRDKRITFEGTEAKRIHRLHRANGPTVARPLWSTPEVQTSVVGSSRVRPRTEVGPIVGPGQN